MPIIAESADNSAQAIYITLKNKLLKIKYYKLIKTP